MSRMIENYTFYRNIFFMVSIQGGYNLQGIKVHKLSIFLTTAYSILKGIFMDVRQSAPSFMCCACIKDSWHIFFF